MEKRVLPCEDCPVDCVLGHINYFMVQDELWEAFGVEGVNKLLCLACFEKRMGRKLRVHDLKHLSMNQAVVEVRFPADLADWMVETGRIGAAQHARRMERVRVLDRERRAKRRAENAPGTPHWVEAMVIPTAMRFVTHGPRWHLQRQVHGEWHLFLLERNGQEGTLYMGNWPDVPDISLDEAKRLST